MTIKEINVEKRIQTPSQKMKDLNQIGFFNAVSQSDQYYRNRVFRVIEIRDCQHLKAKIAKRIFYIMANFIGLPRPFY